MLRKNGGGSKYSFQFTLIRLFIITISVPILIIGLFSYHNMTVIFEENTAEMTSINLEQLKENLRLSLEAYEDVLYQIYTDDDIVAMVDKLNAETDLAVTLNQLRRNLQSMLNAKEYIRSIAIITAAGRVVTYDQLSHFTTENSWISSFSLPQDELYAHISEDSKTHIFPTEYATSFAGGEYYLLHIAHRIIDYRDLAKQNGVVIISIDEEFLRDICEISAPAGGADSLNFIVDDMGRLISYPFQEELTRRIVDPGISHEEKIQAYTAFIDGEARFEGDYISVNSLNDDALKWDIVNVSDQSAVMSRLVGQIKILAAAGILSIMVAVLLAYLLSQRLTESIKQVVGTMRSAGSGDWTARVMADNKMPLEIEAIASQFNSTLDKIEQASMNEKEAVDKQRIAEIKALEARINPHFLYNALDTVNWMAIDCEEFEISHMITSLAKILRYSINDSNAIVPLREEAEWLRQYLYLQQFRSKNSFDYEFEIDEAVLEFPVHKLLFQPFVENSIKHGFKDMVRKNLLGISVRAKGEAIQIIIQDNGCGMDIESSSGVDHIGMANAIGRIKMYYGESAEVKIESEKGVGTVVSILLTRGGES